MSFTVKIINEIWHLSVLLLRLPLKTHIWSHCLMKRVEQCYFKALKTSFVENKGQSGPLSADSKNQGKCQLSVKFSAICQLKFWPFVTCQLTPSRPSWEFAWIKKIESQTNIRIPFEYGAERIIYIINIDRYLFPDSSSCAAYLNWLTQPSPRSPPPPPPTTLKLSRSQLFTSLSR